MIDLPDEIVEVNYNIGKGYPSTTIDVKNKETSRRHCWWITGLKKMFQENPPEVNIDMQQEILEQSLEHPDYEKGINRALLKKMIKNQKLRIK